MTWNNMSKQLNASPQTIRKYWQRRQIKMEANTDNKNSCKNKKYNLI